MVKVEVLGIGGVVPGKVTGYGVFAEGKKVTLKATANKGYVFAGWYEDESFETPCDSSITDYRNPSYAYAMGNVDKIFYARFEPVDVDTILDLTVDGIAVVQGDDPLKSFVVGSVTNMPLAVESLSLPKIAIAGLPAGLKFTAKPIYKKGSKKEIETPANSIYGTPTKPGVYTVTVKLTNTTVKKAIEKKFKMEVPNFTAADHLFRDDGEFYIANEPGDKYSMYVGVKEFDLPKIRLKSSSDTLKVTGLPTGLKYVPGTSSIEGIATKEGIYTVYLTVGKLVSTFTIEIKPLPDWVVGTFEGCGFDDPYFDGSRNVWTISSQGKVVNKCWCSDGNGVISEVHSVQLTRFDSDSFVIDRFYTASDRWGDYRGGGSYIISRCEVDGVVFGVIGGEYWGEEIDSDGNYWEWEGKDFAVQNIWKKDVAFDFLPEIVNGTEMFVDLTGWHEKTFEDYNRWSYPVNGCSFNLKFGKNGAVTAAFYEDGAKKATGTASATLIPYDRVGNTVKAFLAIAIAPKGRHSVCVALYLDIDVSRGGVYGDDMTVTDYLMEAD